MAYNYLDLYNTFVNEISGSAFIFIALSCVVIFYFCAQFRMPNMIILIVISAWMLLLSPFFSSLLPLALLGIAVFLGYNIFKMFTR